MNAVQRLNARLQAIADSLAGYPEALALIGLGSTGQEQERQDQYSDLDFFVVVSAGSRSKFLRDVKWLEEVAPVAYYFRNTPDGYKLLFADRIFCEFAVFEPSQLRSIPFAASRLIWSRPVFETTSAKPPLRSTEHSVDLDWLLGECLTNLYVGLGRFWRGEKLSALRFIQGYALDRLVQLAGMDKPDASAGSDPFSPERRFEQRFPDLASYLPDFLQGYECSPQSADAMLKFIDRHYEVNPSLKAAISELCAGPLPDD